MTDLTMKRSDRRTVTIDGGHGGGNLADAARRRRCGGDFEAS